MENWAAVLPAAKNIGEVAAQALLDGPRGVRVIELAGPEDSSPNDVARVLSQLLGRRVEVVEAPLDAVVPTFTGFGTSLNIAELFRELYAGIASGRMAWEGGSA
jgi:uncharacterized protein YbjT (DUF2867 family)